MKNILKVIAMSSLLVGSLVADCSKPKVKPVKEKVVDCKHCDYNENRKINNTCSDEHHHHNHNYSYYNHHYAEHKRIEDSFKRGHFESCSFSPYGLNDVQFISHDNCSNGCNHHYGHSHNHHHQIHDKIEEAFSRGYFESFGLNGVQFHPYR